MDATPVSMGKATVAGGALPGAGRAGFGRGSATALSMKWSALHDAAAVVGALAGIAGEAMTGAQREFPAAVREVGGRRRERAEQAVEDLAAVMEPGLAALLAVHARGADASAPARALWEEFRTARDAVMALLGPGAGSGPPRLA